jgi:hypothetical protein
MKKLLLLVPGIASLLVSCYKDELDDDALRTNVLDADYNGPAVIELVSGATTPYFNGETQQVEAYVTQTIHVREDLLPPGAGYVIEVSKLNTGESYEYAPGPPPGNAIYYQAELGTDYCYLYRLRVGSGHTKAYRYCTTAEL